MRGAACQIVRGQGAVPFVKRGYQTAIISAYIFARLPEVRLMSSGSYIRYTYISIYEYCFPINGKGHLRQYTELQFRCVHFEWQ